MRNKTLALGLGSNLAVPLQNLRLALSEIKQSPLFEVLKLSSIYESDALLPDNAATAWNKKYLNAVVLCKISDEVSAEAILQEIKKIETRLGRAKAERWAPRLIDIDILYWSGANYVAEKLEIPHGALLKRPFALLPLLEVWPDVDLQRPAWARGWSAEIPFNTIKSQMCFWPKMVGILNITTDSFSDGGKYLNPESLQQQLEKLVGDGAEIIDVGAESTRPGALAVPADIEFKNLHWALSEINISVAISLDCRHPEVVARILDAHQLSYLNDVTGFNDPAMQKLLLLSKLPAFIMHSLGVPPTTERVLDVNQNPCSHLTKWWQQQSQNLIELGISPDQLIFDPGIGFGKTQKQNLYILRHLEELSQAHHPVMIGHSRKSFLKYFSDRPAADLDLETALVTRELNLAYVQYLRVHDVKSQTAALKMRVTYNEAVTYLENLQMMPKTMPGLEKIKAALVLTDWYASIDPNKVIVVAGTNGKGTTCAALESLLLAAGQRVGFYSSPHLVSTTERIRLNGTDISEHDFVVLFQESLPLIEKCGLSHFEAITLMAGFHYFGKSWNSNLDFAIFEVGLGGSFDATNAFPHKYCGITKLGHDHTNILSDDLIEIAKNKFGIVGTKNIVVHHKIPDEVADLKRSTQKLTNSNWVEAEKYELNIKKGPSYFLTYNGSNFQINLQGPRAAENIMTAISLFQVLGFDLNGHQKALNNVRWPGRMQKLEWPDLKCPLYLSGDHNLQGVESLLEILKDFKWKTLHLVVGIGVDKDAEQMLKKFFQLQNIKLYLTETPFKGLKITQYPETYSKLAFEKNSDVLSLLNGVAAEAEDLVLVTGSLYLVGEVLRASCS